MPVPYPDPPPRSAPRACMHSKCARRGIHKACMHCHYNKCATCLHAFAVFACAAALLRRRAHLHRRGLDPRLARPFEIQGSSIT
eukprot:4324714-Pleurochrysis_carterae.AAC.1